MESIQYIWGESEEALLKDITLPLNHCNIPPKLLASLSFQQQPIPINIDNEALWYSDLVSEMAGLKCTKARAQVFQDYMQARFRLSKNRDEYSDDPPPRPKVNYRKLLLGWLFDSDNEQGAAWRSWVESRFGLITQYHKTPVPGPESTEYLHFWHKSNRATYNTNELYAQLDSVYVFCQQELKQRFFNRTHLMLYRGCTDLPDYEIEGEAVKVFNNLSSLTSDPESALRFGSKIYQVQVPMYKIVCFESLFPGSLVGEQEYMVLGGLYRVKKLTYF